MINSLKTSTNICALLFLASAAEGKQKQDSYVDQEIERRFGGAGPVCSFEGKWLLKFKQTSSSCDAELDKTKEVIKFARGVTRFHDDDGRSFELNETASYNDVCTYELKEEVFNAVVGTGWTDYYVYRIRQRGSRFEGDGYLTKDDSDCRIYFDVVGTRTR